MPAFLSDEARVLARPFHAYRALALGDDEPVLVRPLIFLVALGSAISLLTSGRVVAADVVLTAVFWAFVPALWALAAALATRWAAPGFPLSRAVALSFAGIGPWVLLFAFLAGVCLFSSDVYGAFVALLETRALLALLLATAAWGVVITFALFRAGIGLSAGRASVATLLYYAVFDGLLLGYYLATNQIQPQLFGVPA
jgi:membrane-bound acyltransferase YfiQ involved in biofilm formation